ncbi:tetratricopeptide repeat-containing protein [Pseudodesulfovibrio methanolicus]|uniref:Tetratricopeptide repeat-containing protein n=1 Tax=Pseudodesulfovibrio methanolicus TaxID=3126690 RepID=A0ABZ2ISI9_9BACT
MFGTDRQFMNWDLYSVGYPSALTPDIPFWKKEPPISLIAKSLLTQTNLGPLSEYQAIAIVAHSMGGLVAQAACIESKEFAERVSHLVHYGTPSLGLRKAKALGFYKAQIADMKAGGKFIETLRGKWDLITTHGLPFSFLSVAGNQDDFVPSASSLSPFLEEHQAVISGNHVDIVRPVSQTCAGVCLLKNFLESGHYKAGPIDSAALAVERKDFQAAINTYEMHIDELDEKSLGTYALALASLGKAETAIELLQNNLEKGTDIQGILGGRLKRRWLAEGKSGDAEQARELYTEAFRQAESKGDHSQCHYHAINVAFMVLASARDYTEMEKWAKVAMDHANKATRDKWAEATVAEAHLYLGDIETAKKKYKIIFTLGNFSPRELASIALQSLHISEHINSTDFTDFINSL